MSSQKKGILFFGFAFACLLGILLFRGQNQPSGEPFEKQVMSISQGAVSTESVTGDGVAAGDTRRTEGRETKTTKKESKPSVSSLSSRSPSQPSGTTKKKSNSVKSGSSSTDSPTKGKKASHKTATAPTNSPEPSKTQTEEPEETQPVSTSTATPEQKTVGLLIQCKAIMDHRELWKDGIEQVIPADGIFYQGTIPYEEGDSVYDVLKRVCKDQEIAMDSKYTPLYSTYYISGIGNLYEFDCGQESGWKYSVNGVTPGVGCSNYSLKAGDQIVFFYDYQY